MEDETDLQQIVDFNLRVGTHVPDDAAFNVLVLKHFLEKVLHFDDLGGDEADELLKAAMLLARDLAVEDVVEQELIHHGRDHHVDLAPGEVDQHALEPADLTRHVEPHSRGILSRRFLWSARGRSQR